MILCCGGFEFDFEMQKQFLPGWPIYGQGTPGNTGDGIRMAQQAGAALWHMNNPLAGLGGMVVPEFAPVVIPFGIYGADHTSTSTNSGSASCPRTGRAATVSASRNTFCSSTA